MSRLTAYIYGIGLSSGIIGCFYFLSLAADIPIIVTALCSLAAIAFLFRWLHKISLHEKEDHLPLKAGIIACLAMLFITAFAMLRAHKYGDWDAIYIWNLAAKFLKEPNAWTHLFAYKGIETHADYPLLVPANVAFWWRLMGGDSPQVIPFLFGLILTLLTPLLVFFRLAQGNFKIALIAAALLALNPFFLNIGLDQFADVPLSFFFLCAFTSRDNAAETGQSSYITICGAMLGCCLWTKNEGSMLALVFVLFHLRSLFISRHTFLSFVAGIALPLFCLVLFKAIYAPGNDLIEGQQESVFSLLTDTHRYKTIAAYCLKHLRPECYIIFGSLLVWVLFSVFKKLSISKDLLLIAACIAGYLLVYLLTPRDLDWHLSNSIDRVLLHLMPATVYILGREVSKRVSEGAIEPAHPASLP